MPDEAEFVAEATAFLVGICELSDGELAPDQDLLNAGILDSLQILEFLAFIEVKRGRPLPAGAFSAESMATVRKAYELLTAS
jgi:acyl carrier protein